MIVPKILIYGTVARVPEETGAHGPIGWKGRIIAERDRLFWAAGATAQLDYRNYDLPYATNRGDIAIAEAVRNQIRLALGDVTFVNLNWGELDRLDADEIRNGFSLVVIAGSGYFHYSANGLQGDRVARDLLFWENTNAPIVLYGIGVNRPINFLSSGVTAKITGAEEKLLRRTLSRMSLISVRSEDSQSRLASYSDKPVRLVCDPALFLDPHKQRIFRGSLAGTYPTPRIGVNFAFHGPLSNEILRQNLSAYVKILRTLHEETGCSFHYFIHNQTEWIIPQLLRDKGLDVESVTGDPYALMRRYAEINVHLGGMLHSNILATGAYTPCVLLAYDAKHIGFAELIGMESHCHMATALDTEAVLQSLRTLMHNEAAFRRQLFDRLGQLWAEQERFLYDCASLLQPSPEAI